MRNDSFLLHVQLRKCFFFYLTLIVLFTFSFKKGWGQSSFRTVTFTGSINDFNVAERFAAASNNTTYAIAFDQTFIYFGAFRTSGNFNPADNFAIYIDSDPRNTLNSGNGTTTGRQFNNFTPTLPFNADFTSYTELSYTDPLHTFISNWQSAGITPTVFTSSTCREVRIALADLGRPTSIYVSMWMGYNGGIFSNAPGTANEGVGATRTISGFFGSFPVYKTGVNPVSFRTQNTTSSSGGGTAIPNLTLSSSGTINGDFGDISIESSSIGSVTGISSFSGTLTLSGTSSNLALGTQQLNVGGSREIAGTTAGRIVINNTAAIPINGSSTAGNINFLGAGSISGSNPTRTFGSNLTVSLSGGVNFTSSSTVINGILQINANGFVSSNAPSYAIGSTLIYNSGGSFNAGTEWSANAASGAGVPSNVIIGNGVNTTLSFGASNQYRQANGDVTVSANSGLTLSTVGGGDLRVTGNFTQNGTLTHNNRAIFFNGTGTQTISGNNLNATGGGSTNWIPFMYISNTGGTVTLGTNATIQLLDIAANASFSASDATARTLTIHPGSSFTNNGTFNANNGTVHFTGGGGTTTVTGAGSIIFHNAIIEGSPGNTRSVAFGDSRIGGSGTLELRTQSNVTNAPFYNSGSTLIYNTGGVYSRNVEWGAASNQGYPHHVTVQGNTSLDLNTNAIIPPELSIGGDLTIGNATGWGRVYMNNGMDKPLLIRGNLTIGNSNAASNSSELYLTQMALPLPAGFKGDLYLEGNFSRAAGSFFADNNRATFLLGSNNTTIFGATGQTFSFLIIDKQSPSNTVTLNSPVSISQLATFTDGIVISSASNPFVFQALSEVASASFNSFVEGPVEKSGNSPFTFPTGTRVGSELHYRPIRISNLSGSNTYRATFQRLNPYDRGPISAAAKAAGLSVISRCEYWDLTRTTVGAQTATITLSWSTNPTGTSKCNVADYVIPGNETALRVVPFANSTANSWGDNFGYNGHILPDASNNFIGTVSWNMPSDILNNYQRFVIGSTDWRLNPLPVEIRNFSAINKDNRVQLTWLVNNNDQVKYYTIERSRNGMQFENMKQVNARYNEPTAFYSDLDISPINGWGYYRLRITDWQGNISYSNIQKVWIGAKTVNIQISPNPVSGILNISIPESEKAVSISLFHSNGQILREMRLIRNTESLDVSTYPAGQYYLRITTLGGVKNIPFVKY